MDVVGLTIEHITVQQCGMSGQSLSNVLNITISQTTSFSHKVPHSLNVSLFLGNCRDITLQHVTVRNTTGVGLLGNNVLGRSNFTDLNFSSNAYNSDLNTCLAAFTPTVHTSFA